MLCAIPGFWMAIEFDLKSWRNVSGMFEVDCWPSNHVYQQCDNIRSMHLNEQCAFKSTVWLYLCFVKNIVTILPWDKAPSEFITLSACDLWRCFHNVVIIPVTPEEQKTLNAGVTERPQLHLDACIILIYMSCARSVAGSLLTESYVLHDKYIHAQWADEPESLVYPPVKGVQPGGASIWKHCLISIGIPIIIPS